MKERIVWLTVNNKTGKIDYRYLEYDIREQPDPNDRDGFILLDGWSWKPFKLVRADIYQSNISRLEEHTARQVEEFDAKLIKVDILIAALALMQFRR